MNIFHVESINRSGNPAVLPFQLAILGVEDAVEGEMRTIGSLAVLVCAFQSAALVAGLSLCSSGRRRCRNAARVPCSAGTLPIPRLACGGAGTTALSSSSVNDDPNPIIDAVVEGKTAGLARGDGEVGGEPREPRQRKRDLFKKALKDLSALSLLDYKWRSALFKKNEAERKEEEWMAAMMGEDPAYARPMDASGKFFAN